MRILCALALVMLTGLTSAQDTGKQSKRYGIPADTTGYPQKSPLEAMQSVVKAVNNKQIDYLVAQLADPTYVDRMVAEYKSGIAKGPEGAKTLQAFERLVEETAQYFANDPTVVRELRIFAKDAEFDTTGNTSVGSVKTIDGRRVFLKKIDDRWFLENKQQ